MDEATRAHVFDPFFTTKETGKGTGLGLSTAYGVVRQSGGHIWLYSEPGQGTTFKIYLPRVEEPAEPLGLQTETAVAKGGSETILVVEDDDPVRAAAARILVGVGYTVLEAPSGGEALAVAAAHQGDLHLLLTDVVMPGLAAPELAGRLAGEHPGLKVLFTSGYTSDVIARHGILEAGIEYLEKPFTRDRLLRRVREVLDRR
jgi:CheY-like chemotaxis protein